MTQRLVSRRARMPRSRPQTMWGAFGSGQINLAASGVAAQNLTGLLKTVLPSLTNFTIVRIHANLSFRVNSGSASLRVFDFGLTVISQPAFDAGSTAIPDPELDDVDWMFRQSYIPEHNADDFEWTNVAIDNKSQRRLNSADQLLVASFKNRQAVPLTLSLQGNLLVRLH